MNDIDMLQRTKFNCCDPIRGEISWRFYEKKMREAELSTQIKNLRRTVAEKKPNFIARLAGLFQI